MTLCHPHPVTAAAGTAVAVSWAGRVESAYHWLCQARQTAHPNHPVWHFRWNWQTWKTRLLAHLKSPHPSYRFSPVRRVHTAAGERLECWEPQDSLMLKLLAEHLQPVLLPALSSHCHHLKGRGGIKRAVHHVRQTIETGAPLSPVPMPRATTPTSSTPVSLSFSASIAAKHGCSTSPANIAAAPSSKTATTTPSPRAFPSAVRSPRGWGRSTSPLG